VKSIFENPVLFDSDLACRNKSSQRCFGIDWAGFGFGGGGFLFYIMLKGQVLLVMLSLYSCFAAESINIILATLSIQEWLSS
jgi:hypothetical protein